MSAPTQNELDDCPVATKRRVLRRWAFRYWVVGVDESSWHAIVRVIEDGCVLVAACGHLVLDPQRGRNSLRAPDSRIPGCQACDAALGSLTVESYQAEIERALPPTGVTADEHTAGGRHRQNEAAHRVPALSLAEEPEWPIDDPEEDAPDRTYLPGTPGEPTRRAA
jgi:hypothetical protein